MRTERIVVGALCSSGCMVCKRHAGAEAVPRALAAVLADVDAAIARGARELVLGGGEPLARTDLERVVARARERGAERVVLDTHAAALSVPRARALAAAGVTRVRLEASNGRHHTGLLASVGAAALELELSLPITVAGAATASAHIAAARAALGAAAFDILASFPPTADAADLPIETSDIGDALSALDAAARGAAARVRIAPDAGVPPCLVPPRFVGLYALSPGGARRAGYVTAENCARCLVADRCPGVAVARVERFGMPVLVPIASERARRRLTLVGDVRGQIARELSSRNVRRVPGGRPVGETIVRIGFACNQDCDFCFVSTHLPAPEPALVLAAIDAAAARGDRVTLSGGEPTLDPALPARIRYARERTERPVELQTNAIRLAEGSLLEQLEEAGLDEAFVSLHGSDAAISDLVTRAPGTFDRTCAGLDRLVRSRVRTLINFVICRANAHDLPAFIRLVAARWPSVELNVSFVAPSTDLVPQRAALVPTYTEVLPHLEAATREAERLSLRLAPLHAMCGVPLCLAPPSLRVDAMRLPVIDEAEGEGEFVRSESCATCDLRSRCHGLRRSYAQLHGTGELRAVSMTA